MKNSFTYLFVLCFACSLIDCGMEEGNVSVEDTDDGSCQEDCDVDGDTDGGGGSSAAATQPDPVVFTGSTTCVALKYLGGGTSDVQLRGDVAGLSNWSTGPALGQRQTISGYEYACGSVSWPNGTHTFTYVGMAGSVSWAMYGAGDGYGKIRASGCSSNGAAYIWLECVDASRQCFRSNGGNGGGLRISVSGGVVSAAGNAGFVTANPVPVCN